MSMPKKNQDKSHMSEDAYNKAVSRARLAYDEADKAYGEAIDTVDAFTPTPNAPPRRVAAEERQKSLLDAKVDALRKLTRAAYVALGEAL
jgi:hypothetical protein